MLKKIFTIFILFLSLFALFISYKNRPLETGTVDLHLIISKRSQNLAKQKATQQDIKNEGQKIREMITEFSKKHHLVLFAKGTLFSNKLKDYTDEILS